MTSLLTADEVATLLRICLRSVRKLSATGQLPTVRIGSRTLFTQDGVERFVRAREAEASRPPETGRAS